MNRYESSTRWRKDANGAYSSPCRSYVALKEGYSRWRLVAIGESRSFGPFVSLADCQEHASRLERSLGVLR